MIQAPAAFGLLLTLGYLLGAIPFSVIVAKLKSVDLRQIGSGNLGATNVYRALGWRYALLVFVLDVLKGALPVALTMMVFSSPILHGVIAVFSILGHSFSLFLGFRGGKGVATAIGTFLVLTPLPVLIAIGVAAMVIGVTRMVSIGTLVGCVVFPLAVMGLNTDSVLFYFSCLIVLFIVGMHRANIRRLIRGNEHKVI